VPRGTATKSDAPLVSGLCIIPPRSCSADYLVIPAFCGRGDRHTHELLQCISFLSITDCLGAHLSSFLSERAGQKTLVVHLANDGYLYISTFKTGKWRPCRFRKPNDRHPTEPLGGPNFSRPVVGNLRSSSCKISNDLPVNGSVQFSSFPQDCVVQRCGSTHRYLAQFKMLLDYANNNLIKKQLSIDYWNKPPPVADAIV
jgi:hypothetical protein